MLRYKRVLLKLSGETLRGTLPFGVDPAATREVAEDIAGVARAGVEVAIVLGGGNLFRGREARDTSLTQATADSMGMVATVMNGLALHDAFSQVGYRAVLFSALVPRGTARYFVTREVRRALAAKRVVILAGGTGNPYCTTDTAAVLRALQLRADVVLKATKVDGVYDRDPLRYPDARKYERLTHREALARRLEVMDQTAFALAQSERVSINVFRYEAGVLMRIVRGESIGTIVGPDIPSAGALS